MSAFLQPKAHIDALLRVALDGPADRGPRYPGDGWGFSYFYHGNERIDVHRETAERLGAMLVAENVRSLRYRYPDDGMDTLPGPIANGYATDALLGRFDFASSARGGAMVATRARTLTAVQALNAIAGYEYQACEHPGWESSEAHAFCNALRLALIRALPGYDDADTWSIDDDAPEAAPEPVPDLPPAVTDRNEAIAAIRAALRRRSGRAWSVTGGRGTAWGWIRISAPPARLDRFGCMTEADAAELGQLLGFDRPAHAQGESVPSAYDYRTEYVDRAEGRAPRALGQRYWD